MTEAAIEVKEFAQKENGIVGAIEKEQFTLTYCFFLGGLETILINRNSKLYTLIVG